MPRDLIRLVSKGKTKDGKPTRTFYTTSKNKQANANKISKKKFDPRAFNKKTNRNGAHVDFTEEKMK
jgi:ribosomal protein L33